MNNLRPLSSLSRGGILRLVTDAVLLTVSMAAVYIARWSYVLVYERNPNFSSETISDFVLSGIVTTCVFVPLALCLFYFSGFYTFGRAYSSRFKLIVVCRSVTFAFLGFGSVVYLFQLQEAVPRTVLPGGWALSTILLSGARIYSKLFRKTVSTESAPVGSESVDRQHQVLLIGGAGYIGSALIPRFLDAGFKVRCLDICLFGEEIVADFRNHPSFELVKGDYRQIEHLISAFSGVDLVVHLGGIVGDPACAVDEKLTVEVNLTSTKVIAQVAKAHGVRRFLFASSCSVYGQSDELLDEHSKLNPVSLYAKSKIASEKVLQELSDNSFAPVIMRFGTIYGISKRTRFDLVVNLLSAKAVIEKQITVFGGDQWRPFVHVEDVSRAILKLALAPIEAVNGQIFNVGSDGQNYTLGQVGEQIQAIVPDAELLDLGTDADKRNYRVNFGKIRDVAGFEPEWALEEGIRQVVNKMRSGEIESYQEAKYSNVKTLQQVTPESLRSPDENWETNMLSTLE